MHLTTGGPGAPLSCPDLHHSAAAHLCPGLLCTGPGRGATRPWVLNLLKTFENEGAGRLGHFRRLDSGGFILLGVELVL